MVDVEKALKNTIKKGKVKIGSKETKSVIKSEKAKLIVSVSYTHLTLPTN